MNSCPSNSDFTLSFQSYQGGFQLLPRHHIKLCSQPGQVWRVKYVLFHLLGFAGLSKILKVEYHHHHCHHHHHHYHHHHHHHHYPINMIVFYLLQWSLESKWQRHCVQAELTTSPLLIFGIWFFPCHNYHLILILIIREVGLADLGVYVCKADNKLGVQEAAVFLHGEHQQHHIHQHLHFRITIKVLIFITIIIWFITIWETKIMYCRKTDEKEEWRSENKRENPEDNRLEPGLSNVDGQLKQSFWYHTWWTITINVEYRSKTYASCD